MNSKSEHKKYSIELVDSYKTNNNEQVCVVKLKGAFEGFKQESEEFDKIFLHQECKKFILDCHDVKYFIDLQPGVLVQIQEKLYSAGGEMMFIHLSKNIRTCFEMFGLYNTFFKVNYSVV